MQFAVVDAPTSPRAMVRASWEDIGGALQSEHDAERLRAIIESAVGRVFGITQDDFALATRGRARIALARQIAMYICHVVCCQSLTDVGRIFGRDRTTVAHACGVIEDRRDEPRFDRTLELLEHIVMVLKVPRPCAGVSCRFAPVRPVGGPEYGGGW